MATTATPTLASPPAVAALPPPTGAPALHLSARLGASTVRIPVALDWSVTPEAAPATTLFAERTLDPVVPAAAGRYVVTARDGQAQGRLVIDFEGRAPVRGTVELDAGLLRFNSAADQPAGGQSGASLLIRSASGDTGAPTGPVVAVLPGTTTYALLTPGRYSVEARNGLQRVVQQVAIARGGEAIIDTARATVRLTLAAVPHDGARPVDDALFLILEDDPDAATGRREVARSARAQPEFALPAGTYYVIARHQGVEVRERLALAAGESVRRTLSLNTGRLALSSRLLGAGQPIGDGVSYRIERLDVVPADVRRASGGTVDLALAAGRYRIEARAGNANARASEEVEMRAGDTRQLRIELRAGSVALRLRDTGQAGASLHWRVLDADGRTVLVTLDDAPRVTLQAGRYTVQADTRDRRLERAFEVRAGQSQTLDIGP